MKHVSGIAVSTNNLRCINTQAVLQLMIIIDIGYMVYPAGDFSMQNFMDFANVLTERLRVFMFELRVLYFFVLQRSSQLKIRPQDSV